MCIRIFFPSALVTLFSTRPASAAPAKGTVHALTSSLSVAPHPDTYRPRIYTPRALLAAAKGYAGCAVGIILELLKLSALIIGSLSICTQLGRYKSVRDEAGLLQKVLRQQFAQQFNKLKPPNLDQSTPAFQKEFQKFQACVQGSQPIYKVREAFGALLNTPSCIGQSAHHTDASVVEYLQQVATLFYALDGEAMILGHAEREGIAESLECTDMAKIIQQQLGNQAYFSRNGLLSTFEWAAFQPYAAHHGSKASQYKGLEYNCHHSNNTYKGFAFSIDGNPMDFFFGPCPTGDALYEHAILPAMRKQGKTEVRFNYQDQKHGEGERSAALHELAAKNPDVLTVVTLNFDALKGTAVAKAPVESFLEALKVAINGSKHESDLSKPGHFGYYIPKEALPEEDFDTAFRAAEKVHAALQEAPEWAPLSESEKRDVLKLVVDGILSTLILRHTKPTNVTGACKEDMDRGPVENIVMRLFAGFLEDEDHGTKMLKAESRSLVAGAFSRTRHSEQHRNPLKKRFRPLTNLLSCIDKERREAISNVLKTAVS